MSDDSEESTGATDSRADGDEPASTRHTKDPFRASRTSGLWAGLLSMAVVLVLLIVFIAQNTQEVEVTFLGWSGRTSLALALLIAAVAGLFLAAVSASLRMWQVRRRVRRSTR